MSRWSGICWWCLTWDQLTWTPRIPTCLMRSVRFAGYLESPITFDTSICFPLTETFGTNRLSGWRAGLRDVVREREERATGEERAPGESRDRWHPVGGHGPVCIDPLRPTVKDSPLQTFGDADWTVSPPQTVSQTRMSVRRRVSHRLDCQSATDLVGRRACGRSNPHLSVIADLTAIPLVSSSTL